MEIFVVRVYSPNKLSLKYGKPHNSCFVGFFPSLSDIMENLIVRVYSPYRLRLKYGKPHSSCLFPL